MKNKNSISFIIITLFFLLSINNIYAYEVNGKDYKFSHPKGKSDSDIKQACVYTSDGYHSQENFSIVLIYNDNSAYHNNLDETGSVIDNDYTILETQGIQNWTQAEPAIGLDTSSVQSEFLNSQKCPDTLYAKSTQWLKNYFLLGYDKNLPEGKTIDDVKEDLYYEYGDYIYYKRLVVEKEYAQEDLTKCEYDNFVITYTKVDGVVRSASSKNNVPSAGIIHNYYITDSYRNSYNLLDKGKCPVVYLCKEIPLAGGNNYYVYIDETGVAEERSNCKPTRKVCVSGEYCDPDYLGICPTFDNKYGPLKLLYEEYNKTKNKTLLNQAKKIEDQLKSMCRTITKYTNYNSPCFVQCDEVAKLIEKAKGDLSQNIGNCGFSQRLVLWIANIIRWVKYIVPVAVIVLGILDFMKAISADKEDETKKAQQRFIRRLIAAALIFIAPFIIEFILNKLGFAANGCGIINL